MEEAASPELRPTTPATGDDPAELVAEFHALSRRMEEAAAAVLALARERDEVVRQLTVGRPILRVAKMLGVTRPVVQRSLKRLGGSAA